MGRYRMIVGSAEHIILTTARLRLRAYREDDWRAVHEYGADPEVCKYQNWGPNSEEQTQDFVRRCVFAAQDEPPTDFFFVIALLEDNRLIGGCNLSIRNVMDREAMIGYALSPGVWGQGYATEAARALLRFGFTDVGLHRITSWAEPENVGSWRVMEKIGMRREGHEREVWFRDHWRDWVRYAMLDREWTAQNS